jgi:hypothetical protein
MTETQNSEPLTGEQIVGIIRDHWMAGGMDWNEADRRGELGFAYMLDEGSIREWGFTATGETLYEPCTAVAQTIVVTLLKKEE